MAPDTPIHDQLMRDHAKAEWQRIYDEYTIPWDTLVGIYNSEARHDRTPQNRSQDPCPARAQGCTREGPCWAHWPHTDEEHHSYQDREPEGHDD